MFKGRDTESLTYYQIVQKKKKPINTHNTTHTYTEKLRMLWAKYKQLVTMGKGGDIFELFANSSVN